MTRIIYILQILLLLCSTVSFIYGTIKYLIKKAPLFNRLVTCAVGCMMLERLFRVVMTSVKGNVSDGFHVGLLGIFGCFMFLFSASFGQMDGLVDDKSKSLRKYRLISLSAPSAIALIYVPVLLSDVSVTAKITTGIVFISLILSSYFSLKHIIMPDVDFGILSSIRGYSAVALILTVFYAIQLTAEKMNFDILFIASSVLICVCTLALIPVLDRGSKKWTV